jgi:hypothetical protein
LPETTQASKVLEESPEIAKVVYRALLEIAEMRDIEGHAREASERALKLTPPPKLPPVPPDEPQK